MSVGTEKRPPFSAPKQAESPPPAGGTFGAEISGKNANGCICDRPKALILCQSCGFKLAAGRVQRRCPVPKHERRISLMDLGACPNCKAGLEFLVEK